MNQKGAGDLVRWNVAYLLIGILFFVGMFYFVSGYSNGTALSEDFYAKYIASVINRAEPGTEIRIDVSKAMKIAEKNDFSDLSRIVRFDNEKNEVIVSLKDGSGVAFQYFNDVVIFEPQIEFAQGEGLKSNYLVFKVRENVRKSLGEGNDE